MENRISQTVALQYDTVFSPYTTAEFDEALSDLERFGFTGAELAVCYPDKVDIDALNKKLAAHKLTATTLSTGQVYGRDGLSLTEAAPDKRRRAQAIVSGHIALSARIGKPPVTVGLLRGKGESPDKAALCALLRETLLPLVDEAVRAGVTLQIEPICKAEVGFINSTAEGLAFLHSLGDPANVGLLFDLYHANLEDGDSFAAIAMAAGRITNVHLADSNRGLPGTADIPFPALCRAIVDTGYTGAFCLENKNVPSVETVKAEYAERMKRIFA